MVSMEVEYNKNEKKIREKSSGWGLLIPLFVPLVVIALYASISFSLVSKRILKQDVVKQASAALQIASADIMDTLGPELHSIRVLSREIPRVYHSQNETDKIITSVAEIQPDLISMYYFVEKKERDGGNGLFSNSIGWKAPDDMDLTTRPWYLEAVAKKGEIVYTDPYVDAMTGNLCITLSKAVYDDRNTFLGVIGLDIIPHTFSEVVGSVNLSAHTDCYVVDSNGLYLTNKDPDSILTKSYLDEMGTNLTDGEKSQYLDGTTKSFTRGKKFFAVNRIGDSPYFIVCEGLISDFTGSLTLSIVVIIIVLVILIIVSIFINLAIIKKIYAKEKDINSKVIAETQNLVVAAKENAATSQDQSAAVKEIVTTMEDNNNLSDNIKTKIGDVSEIAQTTSDNVSEGVSALQSNVDRLHEIDTANKQTIETIKELGNKIEKVWNIVNLITNITDQTKIIAFNAELEASSAGEAGRNFHIVANEIRRLADGITSGTVEIKQQIKDVQLSSDALILTSEKGTELINQGCQEAESLKIMFEHIKVGSESTANSAVEIDNIIQQQNIASKQIFITLKQIAAGVENFSKATENISKSSEVLKQISTKLVN